MNRPCKSGKGQISLEAGILLLFILIVLVSIWLGGPIQQSTEKSIDTNDLILAEHFLDTVASAVEIAGMSGIGEKYDFVAHIPYNTVDITYGESIGPHINISVLLYTNLTMPGGEGFSQYSVNSTGYPIWYTPWEVGPNELPNTPFLYKTLTKKLKFPLNTLNFSAERGRWPSSDSFLYKSIATCDIREREDSTISRGPSTQFLDVEGRPIKFCKDAGFNLHLFARKYPADVRKVEILSRYYYNIPGDWRRTR